MALTLDQQIMDAWYSHHTIREIADTLEIKEPSIIEELIRSGAEPSPAISASAGVFTSIACAGDFGVNGVTPVPKASAYTKTYNTASRVIAAPTAATVATANASNLATCEALANELKVQLNALIADALGDKKNTVATVSDLQGVGISG